MFICLFLYFLYVLLYYTNTTTGLIEYKKAFYQFNKKELPQLIFEFIDNFLVHRYNVTAVQHRREWRKMFLNPTAGCILTGTFHPITREHVQVVW